MKSKEIFCLVIRLLGLIFLYQALAAVPGAISLLWSGASRMMLRNVFLGWLMVLWPLAVAFWMVRGAPALVRLAYSGRSETSPSQGS